MENEKRFGNLALDIMDIITKDVSQNGHVLLKEETTIMDVIVEGLKKLKEEEKKRSLLAVFDEDGNCLWCKNEEEEIIPDEIFEKLKKEVERTSFFN